METPVKWRHFLNNAKVVGMLLCRSECKEPHRLEAYLMKWMRTRELPPWAWLLGALLISFGPLLSLFSGNVWLGAPLICLGLWLLRWWLEVPADPPRVQKMSERRFRVYQRIISVCSWGMLILTVISLISLI